MAKTYWLSPLAKEDDFGDTFDKSPGGIMYDAKTKMGPWANMTEKSFKEFGLGRLGLDLGQKYEMQKDGKWMKIAG